MKRVIIILVATFALFTDYIHVNAHPNCETFSVNQLENDNSFIELMTTNPETIFLNRRWCNIERVYWME